MFKVNKIHIKNQNEKTANNGKWSEGFNNVGNKFSFTDYKSTITNQDTYVYANNVDTTGNNLGYPNGFLKNLAMFLNALHFWAISLGLPVLVTNLVKSPSVSLARALLFKLLILKIF